ncbi:hypothetical protein GCM10022256_02070 [Frondihabitans peucedani]|uniref:Uncharacterized protein n=1 Tax=Frondihabitans peucedani TaxID=598626 RepID=A0ABP8DX79_9MICO
MEQGGRVAEIAVDVAIVDRKATSSALSRPAWFEEDDRLAEIAVSVAKVDQKATRVVRSRRGGSFEQDGRLAEIAVRHALTGWDYVEVRCVDAGMVCAWRQAHPRSP